MKPILIAQCVIVCVRLEEMSIMEQNSLPLCCSLMMARGVASLADGDASLDIVLQTSANQLLLVAENLDEPNHGEAFITVS